MHTFFGGNFCSTLTNDRSCHRCECCQAGLLDLSGYPQSAPSAQELEYVRKILKKALAEPWNPRWKNIRLSKLSAKISSYRAYQLLGDAGFAVHVSDTDKLVLAPGRKEQILIQLQTITDMTNFLLKPDSAMSLSQPSFVESIRVDHPKIPDSVCPCLPPLSNHGDERRAAAIMVQKGAWICIVCTVENNDCDACEVCFAPRNDLKELPQSNKACPHCTFVENSADALACSMCETPRSLQLVHHTKNKTTTECYPSKDHEILNPESANSRKPIESAPAGEEAWACVACTYANSSDTSKCSICLTPRPFNNGDQVSTQEENSCNKLRIPALPRKGLIEQLAERRKRLAQCSRDSGGHAGAPSIQQERRGRFKVRGDPGKRPGARLIEQPDPSKAGRWLIRTMDGVHLPRLSDSDCESISSLASGLVKKARAIRQLDKFELLFKWVATNIQYDMETFRGQNRKSQRAPDVLKNRMGVCAGYSNLFKALCEEVGLECAIIGGWANGGSGKDERHAWNAIKVDDKWYFDQCLSRMAYCIPIFKTVFFVLLQVLS